MANELFLQHHGILGQKWGIRRYQNKDGSLTAAGKKRLEKDVKDLSTVDYSKNPEYFNNKVNSMSGVKQFKKDNKKEIKQIRSDKWDLMRDSQEYDQIYFDYMQYWWDHPADAKKKYAEAINYAETVLKSNINELEKRLSENERNYEKKANEFIKGYLGEYGNIPVKGSVSFDKKTKKISEANLASIAAFEVYRNSGGRI